MIENSKLLRNPSDWRDTLADLIVSDERRLWILERYPFDDVGRPGILHVEPKRRRHPRKKRDVLRWGDVIHGSDTYEITMDADDTVSDRRIAESVESDEFELAEAA